MHFRRFNGSLTLGILILAVAMSAAACSENPVGRKCFIGVDAGNDNQAIVASPALECDSRICLHYPKQNGATPPEGAIYSDQCTAECDSDSDCDKVPESPCVSGFTCAVPVVVGPFCCRKMCICKDFLIVPEGGLPEQKACNSDDPANTCCNLSGRGDSPQCQG